MAATNQNGELVALIASHAVTELPEDLGLEGDMKVGRPEICWDNVCVGEVFSPRALKLSGQENKRYCDEIDDDDALYQTHIHPHYLLSLANEALMQEYAMPAWIRKIQDHPSLGTACWQRSALAQCGYRPLGA